jgi:integrase
MRARDLRHLFATMTIESGEDNSTVSRWPGHEDDGALAITEETGKAYFDAGILSAPSMKRSNGF